MPLAPLGCTIQFDIKPNRRKAWGEHSSDDWYLGTSPKHYRDHIIFVSATKTQRITNTIFFKHCYITQPTITPKDAVVQALQDLTHTLSQ
jgi:hypothetical protein